MSKDMKYDGDKVRLDLVEPDFILGVGRALTYGANKYEAESWKTVKNRRNRYYGALMRHLMAWRKGELIAADSGIAHLEHASANLMFLQHFDKENEDARENCTSNSESGGVCDGSSVTVYERSTSID